MILLLSILALLVGTIAFDWYLSYVLGPYGRIAYPPILRHPIGHILCLFLALVATFAFLYIYTFYESLLTAILLFCLLLALSAIAEIFLIEIRMSYSDRNGLLYSAKGLRFGGIATSEFLDAVELIESKLPTHFLLRDVLIGEAHYLATSVYAIAEFLFVLVIVVSSSLTLSLIAFLIGFLGSYLEIYFRTPTPHSFYHRRQIYLSRQWQRYAPLVLPLTIVAFYPIDTVLCLTLTIFALVQGLFGLVAALLTMPMRWLTLKLLPFTRFANYPIALNFESFSLHQIISKWTRKANI